MANEFKMFDAQPRNKMGSPVSSLFRDFLIAHLSIDYQKAQSLAESFDEHLTASDFLTTLNGTTFTKTFEPKAE